MDFKIRAKILKESILKYREEKLLRFARSSLRNREKILVKILKKKKGKRHEKGNLEIHSSDAGGDTDRYCNNPWYGKLYVIN